MFRHGMFCCSTATDFAKKVPKLDQIGQKEDKSNLRHFVIYLSIYFGLRDKMYRQPELKVPYLSRL